MSIKLYEPGEMPTRGDIRGGDLVLVHSDYRISKLIQFCTNSFWNHVAVVLNEEGDITEALGSGIIRSNLSEWKQSVFIILSPEELTDQQRREITEHAGWIVGQGWSYDKVTLVGMILFWISGGKFMLSGGAKSAICSGHGADCYHAAGWKFPEKIPYFYTPKDIAKHFGVPIS